MELVDEPLAPPENNTDENTNSVMMTKVLDPVLQAIILLLSMLCYFLLRKIQALTADLQALQASSTN
jgi:hypothetical protein